MALWLKRRQPLIRQDTRPRLPSTVQTCTMDSILPRRHPSQRVTLRTRDPRSRSLDPSYLTTRSCSLSGQRSSCLKGSSRTTRFSWISTILKSLWKTFIDCRTMSWRSKRCRLRRRQERLRLRRLSSFEFCKCVSRLSTGWSCALGLYTSRPSMRWDGSQTFRIARKRRFSSSWTVQLARSIWKRWAWLNQSRSCRERCLLRFQSHRLSFRSFLKRSSSRGKTMVPIASLRWSLRVMLVDEMRLSHIIVFLQKDRKQDQRQSRSSVDLKWSTFLPNHLQTTILQETHHLRLSSRTYSLL